MPVPSTTRSCKRSSCFSVVAVASSKTPMVSGAGVLLASRPSGSRLREVTMKKALFITTALSLMLFPGVACTSECLHARDRFSIPDTCDNGCIISNICVRNGSRYVKELAGQYSVSCAGPRNDCVADDDSYCPYTVTFPAGPDSHIFGVVLCKVLYEIRISNGYIIGCSPENVGVTGTTDDAENASPSSTGTLHSSGSGVTDATPSTSIPAGHSYGVSIGIPVAVVVFVVIVVVVVAIGLWCNKCSDGPPAIDSASAPGGESDATKNSNDSLQNVVPSGGGVSDVIIHMELLAQDSIPSRTPPTTSLCREKPELPSKTDDKPSYNQLFCATAEVGSDVRPSYPIPSTTESTYPCYAYGNEVTGPPRKNSSRTSCVEAV